MQDSVIILAADAGYIEHAKSLFVNCVKQGQWTGDLALVVPAGTDTSAVANRGIHIVEAPSIHAFYQKFAIFSPFFRQWDKAFYMDCDVLVQDPIDPLFDELIDNKIIAVQEPFTLEHCFTNWRPECNFQRARDGRPPLLEEVALFEWLWKTYDKSFYQFNTALMLFRPSDIPEQSPEMLEIMRTTIDPINTHVIKGTDQPIINLVFYGQFSEVRDGLLSYFGCETDKSRVLHYCSGYAPWIAKTVDAGGQMMDGYYNGVLDAPCHDVYTENLALFDYTFPQVRN